jgi:hypothetical protein
VKKEIKPPHWGGKLFKKGLDPGLTRTLLLGADESVREHRLGERVGVDQVHVLPEGLADATVGVAGVNVVN